MLEEAGLACIGRAQLNSRVPEAVADCHGGEFNVLRRSTHPVYLAQRERLYEGLRKAEN